MRIGKIVISRIPIGLDGRELFVDAGFGPKTRGYEFAGASYSIQHNSKYEVDAAGESVLAEIRDSMIRDMQKEIRCLKYDIGEINMKYEFACTSKTLDDLRIRVDRHEAELGELQR